MEITLNTSENFSIVLGLTEERANELANLIRKFVVNTIEKDLEVDEVDVIRFAAENTSSIEEYTYMLKGMFKYHYTH